MFFTKSILKNQNTYTKNLSNSSSLYFSSVRCSFSTTEELYEASDLKKSKWNCHGLFQLVILTTAPVNVMLIYRQSAQMTFSLKLEL